MKVYIWVDMDGISGMSRVEFMYPENQSLDKRRLVTREANAAIEGALAAGATTIYVNDAHPPEHTILIEELNPAAQLVPNGITQFTISEIDDSFDALFAIGLHAKMGTYGAFCDHHWDAKNFWAIRVNGVSIGEIGITALAAAYFGVPMILVAGDRAACQEAQEFLGSVETVETKVGVSRYQARCYPPVKVHEELRQKATKALQNISAFPLPAMKPPYACEIDFVHTQGTRWALMIPGTEMVGPRTVRYVAKDGWELLRHQLLTIAVCRFGAMDPMF